MPTLHQHIGTPFCTKSQKWRFHPGCHGHYLIPSIINNFSPRQACAYSCIVNNKAWQSVVMVPCIGCSCPFMCSSKSSCSCVELLAPLMPELNTIPVTQYRSKSQQILACPHQHTSHFPSQWLATLTSRRLTEQNSYLFSCSLLLSPNLVLACSFFVPLLATIWKCNWWFLWIKKFTSSETKSFVSWAPWQLLFTTEGLVISL